MKPNIHPDYHEIFIEATDGTTHPTRSCWGKPGDTLKLDVDPKTHPAWVGGIHIKKTGQIEKFNKRFAAFDAFSSGSKKEEEKKDEA